MKKHLNFDPDYTPKDPENHFYQIGINLLEEEIEQVPSIPVSPEYELKPITLRLPAYQIAVIDAVASAGEMTRQEFLSHLFESSIGGAFIGLASGFSPSTSQEEAGTTLLNTTYFLALSEVARRFLIDTSFASLGHEITMTEAVQIMANGLETLGGNEDA
ncbi:hypothetical protein ACF3NA_11025 (plasmid) [Alkanindiges sp. WGS2144]|uniref:hypothetical protein n=1 Tax=Alkanindiges sp. WGS2144 TaxID=3366808 RepID=UPI0037518B43